jgi:predicted permease
MDRLEALRARIRAILAILLRRHADEEMEEELRFHLDMETELNLSTGMSPEEARRRALVAFGGVERHRERLREGRRVPLVESAWRDLRLGLRSLRRTPAFTATALSILALGIGMATAMFTVFDAVLLRPLPVSDPDRVVLPHALAPNGVTLSLTPQDFDALRDATRTLTDVVGVAHQGAFTNALMDGDRMLALRGAWVTGGFFELLGAQPALGRLFGPEDEVPNASPSSAIVLSYETWRGTFGGDSTVIGRVLVSPHGFGSGTIIGVAPPGLGYPAGSEYWAPVVYGSLDVIARLAPDATPEIAAAEFVAVVEGIIAERRGVAPDYRVEVQTFTEMVLGDVRPQLRVLVAAVALLLLIACVNVGNLVLLRAKGRAGEVAVRRSLGARTSDVVRPLLWENAALCVAGGLLGLATARGLLAAFARLAPPELPRLDLLRLSAAPVSLAAAVTLVPLLAALMPAILPVRTGIASSLRSDARAGLEGSGGRRLRQGLVAVQIATALVMLAGAGLLVRSLDRLVDIPLGYQPEHLSVITVAKPVDLQTEGWHVPMGELYDRVAPELQAVPGVVSLTPVNFVPFHGPEMFNLRWMLPGQTEAEAANNPVIPYEVGGPDYFRTFDIPILRGRGFLERDGADAPPVAVVSSAVAERFWPGEDPVGRQLLSIAGTVVTIVGEAGDIRYRLLREETPTVYLPWRQVFFQGFVAIRTTEPLAALLPDLNGAVRAGDPEARIALAQTVEAHLDGQLALARLSTLLASGFGLAALLLAAIGLYGVMASTVRDRTHELGVRVALGATPARLRASVLAQAGVIAAAGGSVGLLGSLATGPFLRTLLFEVPPLDPVALLGAAAALLLVVLVAAYVPASFATRADPMHALRAE